MSEFHDPADDFDGIQEDDNPLPNWWVLSFIGAIFFSVFYIFHYHFDIDRSLAKEYADDKARIEQLAAAQQASPEDQAAKLAAAFINPETIKLGSQIFMTRCAACHGPGGEGLIGPNLTDKHWIHGDGSLDEIAKVVINGVPDKGMVAWGAQLSDDEIISVVVYVKTLDGLMKPGKAPEGQKFD